MSQPQHNWLHPSSSVYYLDCPHNNFIKVHVKEDFYNQGWCWYIEFSSSYYEINNSFLTKDPLGELYPLYDTKEEAMVAAEEGFAAWLKPLVDFLKDSL